MTQKYIAIRPWHGVAKGDTVEFKNGVPPALRPNVRPVIEGTDHTAKAEQSGMLAPLVPEAPPALAPLEPPAAPGDKPKK